ncbi:unnamed protein product [Heligmosomoides polygyrus]|uniref:IBB domain-containing protein n=1 Tax=Heligmosomoides polygyrus TaxID=6339 RepID=A0A183G851_HELPZ|nr:unnamed protein product [Heligmosomoides polygyrus]
MSEESSRRGLREEARRKRWSESKQKTTGDRDDEERIASKSLARGTGKLLATDRRHRRTEQRPVAATGASRTVSSKARTDRRRQFLMAA